MQWIKVTDRLPEATYQQVLTYSEFGQEVHLWKGTYFDCEFPIVPDSKITHWMPLPEPPKS